MIGDRGNESHAASFTDLMASLMVIFVLLFVAYVNNAAAKGKTVRDDLLSQLRERLRSVGLSQEQIRQDERDKNAIVIVMPDSLLFSLGSRTVRSNGVQALRDLMPLLSGVLCDPRMRDNIQAVVIEGHTDTTWAADGRVGLEKAREYNLELSQGRSMEVVKTSLGMVSSPEHRSCFRGLLSASGRGQEEPLPQYAGNDPRQRRVVFKVRVATDVTADLAEDVSSTDRKVRVAQ